ncbi:22767_t:CDS:2, partial [Gigaspora margarita]
NGPSGETKRIFLESRPSIFFVKFKYRNSSTAHHEYELRLNEALKEEPESEKLLTLHSKLKNGEFRDEWQRFKERNTNPIVKKRIYGTDESVDKLATTDNFKGEMSSLTPLAEIDNIRKKERKNDEFESDVYETIRNGKTWIIHGTDVCDELEKWKQGKSRSRTDLAFYDIVDITPGSNSDFIRSLQNDVVEEMRQSKEFTKPKMDNADGMKDFIIKFTEAKDFRRFVNECFSSMQVNERTKFIWDYIYMLTESFERDNDLSDDNLSEFGYREIFFSPLIRYLFRGTHKTIKIDFGEKSLFASSEDRNREKTDGEDRNFGRKIDIIWSMKSSDLEFAVGEISGPPNKINHAHFFNDKIKIAKMLKELLERSLLDLRSYIHDACTRTPPDKEDE